MCCLQTQIESSFWFYRFGGSSLYKKSTFFIIFLEMSSAMCTRIHVLESLKPASHDFLFLIGGFLWIVGSKGVEKRPWILSEFLAIERTWVMGFNIVEITSESTERTLFADRIMTILFVLFEHGFYPWVVINIAKKYNSVSFNL